MHGWRLKYLRISHYQIISLFKVNYRSLMATYTIFLAPNKAVLVY